MRPKLIREFSNTGKVCRVDGCQKPAFCKGACRMHYARNRKRGSFDLPRRKTPTEILYSNRKISSDGCWLWNGVCNTGGYGQMYIYPCRIPKGVHRVAFEIFKGEIPKGMHVLHRCDVRHCFNPDHLFVGTDLDNMRDCSQKNRIAFGTRQPHAKLNDEFVKAIRVLARRDGLSQSEIAKRFGCSQTAVSLAVSGKRWRRVA